MSRDSRRKPKADLRVESLEGKALLSTLAGSGGSNQAYVDSLYNQVLNRPPDTAGEAFWVGALDSGVSRRAVLSKFQNSPEVGGSSASGITASNVSGGTNARARAFVDSLYETYLQRSPDAEGEAFWVNQLRRGAARSSVRAAFVNSIESEAANGTGASGTSSLSDPSLGFGMVAGSATTPGGTGGFGTGNGTGTYGLGTGTTTGTGTSSGLGGTTGTISGLGTGSQGTGTGTGINTGTGTGTTGSGTTGTGTTGTGTTGTVGTGTTGGSTTTGTTVGTVGNGTTTGTGTIGSGGGNTPTSSSTFIGPISSFGPATGTSTGSSTVGSTTGTPNSGTTSGTTTTGAQQTNAPLNGNGTTGF